jgi:hypothetical protein
MCTEHTVDWLMHVKITLDLSLQREALTRHNLSRLLPQRHGFLAARLFSRTNVRFALDFGRRTAFDLRPNSGKAHKVQTKHGVVRCFGIGNTSRFGRSECVSGKHKRRRLPSRGQRFQQLMFHG